MFHKAHLTCAELRYPLLYLQDGPFSGGQRVRSHHPHQRSSPPPVVLPPQRAGVIACTLVCCMLLRFRLNRGYTVMRATSLAYTGSTLCSCYLTVCTVFWLLFFFIMAETEHTGMGGQGDLEGRDKIHQTNGRSFTIGVGWLHKKCICQIWVMRVFINSDLVKRLREDLITFNP